MKKLKKSGDDARRREIVFAVFFAETYLFEWIRDEVAQSDISILNSYFDDCIRKRGVKDKWKEITKKLCTKNHIQNFNWDSRYWAPFIKLVDARDGLVHAKASRPQQAGQLQGDQPFPSRNYLNQMTPGSAVQVIVNLVTYWHKAMGSHPKEWVVDMSKRVALTP